jgi:molybdopterin-binding protein
VPQFSVGQAAGLLGQSTRVTKDKVMAQADVHAGGCRVVWLVRREAVDELHVAQGTFVVTSVKSTSVEVELPKP